MYNYVRMYICSVLGQVFMWSFLIAYVCLFYNCIVPWPCCLFDRYKLYIYVVLSNPNFDSDIQPSVPNKNIHFQRVCVKFRPLASVLALMLYVSNSCLARSDGTRMQVRDVSIELFPATGWQQTSRAITSLRGRAVASSGPGGWDSYWLLCPHPTVTSRWSAPSVACSLSFAYPCEAVKANMFCLVRCVASVEQMTLIHFKRPLLTLCKSSRCQGFLKSP